MAIAVIRRFLGAIIRRSQSTDRPAAVARARLLLDGR